MKHIFLIFGFVLCMLGSFAQTCNTTAPTYTTIGNACNSGNFTTSSEWVGGVNPPYTLTGGAYTIPAGIVVDIASSNFALNYDLIVYGTLLIDGKLAMTNNSNKIVVMSGGLVTCCSTGYCGSSCPTCSDSDKIAIGGNNIYCGDVNGCGSVNGSFTGPAILSNTGLPITLISFDAKVDGNKVDLNWSTATEINFNYFLLEKSSDGSKFDSIGFVKGHGTTAVKQNYETVDETPFIGLNYYRLTSVDFDKTIEIFKVAVVKYEGERNVSLSPNPFNGTQITLNSNFEFNGLMDVYDNLGSLIFKDNVTGGLINFVSPLRTGIYVVKLTSGDFSKSIRLVVN